MPGAPCCSRETAQQLLQWCAWRQLVQQLSQLQHQLLVLRRAYGLRVGVNPLQQGGQAGGNFEIAMGLDGG